MIQEYDTFLVAASSCSNTLDRLMAALSISSFSGGIVVGCALKTVTFCSSSAILFMMAMKSSPEIAGTIIFSDCIALLFIDASSQYTGLEYKVDSVSFLGTFFVTLIMVTTPITRAMTPVKMGDLPPSDVAVLHASWMAYTSSDQG